jgi:glycerate-2-kinase
LPLPRKGLSLSEKKTITKSLLRAGANINELNAVRKHLSEIKGGWLAKKASGASIITLIISDVVGDPVDVIASGPTAPDQSSFSDAISVLKKYRLWKRAPKGIRKILTDGKAARIPETPKSEDGAFNQVKHFILFNNRQACEAAAAYLKSCRLTTAILSTTMEGEANQVGRVLGSIAREMAIWDRPLAKPSAFVIGGETTVTVHGNGTGGRNQEVALSAALGISSTDGAVVASMGTDGIDGPTDAAGAIVDGSTITRAEALHMSAGTFLAENDAYNFFLKLGDLISTGPTGTNVNDVAIMIALDERSIVTGNEPAKI